VEVHFGFFVDLSVACWSNFAHISNAMVAISCLSSAISSGILGLCSMEVKKNIKLGTELSAVWWLSGSKLLSLLKQFGTFIHFVLFGYSPCY